MFLGREIMASDIAGKLGVDKGEMRRETLEILRDLGIDSKSCDAPTPGLSGGQRQAIAVARAMK
tara:strand:+ start:417 stop:608 length:192 start_codon:yes stop_codon:yes gene_type:complete